MRKMKAIFFLTWSLRGQGEMRENSYLSLWFFNVRWFDDMFMFFVLCGNYRWNLASSVLTRLLYVLFANIHCPIKTYKNINIQQKNDKIQWVCKQESMEKKRKEKKPLQQIMLSGSRAFPASLFLVLLELCAELQPLFENGLWFMATGTWQTDCGCASRPWAEPR